MGDKSEYFFPSKRSFEEWLKKNKYHVVSHPYVDEVTGVATVKVITRDGKEIEAKYKIHLFDVFPRFENMKDLERIIEEFKAMGKEKLFVRETRHIHPPLIISELMNMINIFKMLFPLDEASVDELAVIKGLLDVIEVSFKTWKEAMEQMILSLIIKRVRNALNKEREYAPGRDKE